MRLSIFGKYYWLTGPYRNQGNRPEMISKGIAIDLTIALAWVFSGFNRENRLVIPFKAVFNTAVHHYLVTHIYPPFTDLSFEPGGQSCSVMLPSSGFVGDAGVDCGVIVVGDSCEETPKKFG